MKSRGLSIILNKLNFELLSKKKNLGVVIILNTNTLLYCSPKSTYILNWQINTSIKTKIVRLISYPCVILQSPFELFHKQQQYFSFFVFQLFYGVNRNQI